MRRAIRMNEIDHVATLLDDAKANDEIGVFNPENKLLYSLTCLEDIPFGNKIALCDLSEGCLLVKYGAVVGQVTRNIGCGQLVHVHNVKSRTVDIPPAIREAIIRQMGIGEE